MTTETKPATDADLVTYRQWNQSMLSHPRLATRTVVDGLLARVAADAVLILPSGCSSGHEPIRYKAEKCPMCAAMKGCQCGTEIGHVCHAAECVPVCAYHQKGCSKALATAKEEK